jgi:hypothetical protein
MAENMSVYLAICSADFLAWAAAYFDDCRNMVCLSSIKITQGGSCCRPFTSAAAASTKLNFDSANPTGSKVIDDRRYSSHNAAEDSIDDRADHDGEYANRPSKGM